MTDEVPDGWPYIPDEFTCSKCGKTSYDPDQNYWYWLCQNCGSEEDKGKECFECDEEFLSTPEGRAACRCIR